MTRLDSIDCIGAGAWLIESCKERREGVGQMADGKDCICAARSEYECGCEADWTPQAQINLERENAQLKSTSAELNRIIGEQRAEIEDHKIEFWSIVETHKLEEEVRRELINEQSALIEVLAKALGEETYSLRSLGHEPFNDSVKALTRYSEWKEGVK